VFVGDAPGTEVADAPRAAVDPSFGTTQRMRHQRLGSPAAGSRGWVARPPRAKSMTRCHSGSDGPGLNPTCKYSATARMSASVIGSTLTARTPGMALSTAQRTATCRRRSLSPAALRGQAVSKGSHGPYQRCWCLPGTAGSLASSFAERVTLCPSPCRRGARRVTMVIAAAGRSSPHYQRPAPLGRSAWPRRGETCPHIR
jgi:hypothetical protein